MKAIVVVFVSDSVAEAEEHGEPLPTVCRILFLLYQTWIAPCHTSVSLETLHLSRAATCPLVNHTNVSD